MLAPRAGGPGGTGGLGSADERPDTGGGASGDGTGGGVMLAGMVGGGAGRPASGCDGGEPGTEARLGPFFAYCFIASLTR